MTPERWKQIEEIFQAALDLPAAEREGYVSEAAGADEELREQVRALISQHDEAGDFIEEPAVAMTGVVGVQTDPHATTPDSELFDFLDDPFTGRRIGAYRVVREIGRGGMGAVYLAERAEEFRRRVAIKLIKRGMDTDFILRRFRNERQILATLDHPYIARLLDGGTTDDGLPYFVMEYIEGLPLYRFCDERKLTIPERLRLFRQVCDAVHYAHRQQVIHRDIKPSNILVTSDGAPKLLDFGIAKLLNPALAADITLDPTATAMRLMTPEYASPEQVRGEPVTAASDVYSLGVLLYELLTGHRPYRLRHRAPHELARVICEEEPAHPSIVITRPDDLLPAHAPDGQTATLHYLYWSRNATVESLRRELSGDLDRVVMKALRKETVERYRTAEEMRDDITRFLEGRPVLAPPIPTLPGRGKASQPFEPPTDEKSIAVLPLKILDPQAGLETGDEFLGVGLADALITRLGALRRFTVRPTSTVLRYGQNGADPVAAGRELGVSYVVDGHVRRGAGRVRVTVQLLDVRDGSTIWGGQFDEPFTDVLVLEDAISSQVAEALVPHLTGAERRQLAKRGTDNSDAFEAYLRGRYHWNTFTEEGFAKAINCYYQAVAHDPDYALAYTGIADYYNWLGVYVILPFRETSAAAKEAASKAVELDPELAEGFAALGFATLTHDFDWETAEGQLRRALELNPSYATAHSWYGFQLAMEGRFDESVAAMRRAVELDPLSPIHQHALSWCLYQARRYEEAAAAARKLIADEPNYGVGHFFLGWILRHVGQHDEAVRESVKGVELLGRGPYVLGGLGMTYAAAGRMEEAREVLREILEVGEQRHVSPYHLALLYRHLGEHEEAFRQLERAFEMNDAWVVWMAVEPQFDPLRSDPRFAALVRRTNNPLASRRGDRPGPTTGQKSVAVLPFRVLSVPGGGGDSTGDEYLGVGLADALITRLSNLRRFIVRPTSSVLRYSGGEVDPFLAGRETGADFVVDGNVRRAGDVLRVTVQLLSVAEGATRWAGRFDEKVTDVLMLEDTLSEQVAVALVPQLSGDEREQLAKRGTDNAQAFEAYLRGRFHWHSLTEEGFAKAIENYRLAVELDPDYAVAYAGIADYHIFLGIYGLKPFAECSAAAKEAAERAVELDDTLAEGHAALGFALVTNDFDWEAAEREHRRALELNPNNATARDWYSFLLLNQGRFDEALSEVERAHELDPLTPLVSMAVAWCHYHARRFDESVAVHRKVVDSEPRFAYGRLMYSWALRRAGRRGEAVEQAERAMQIGGEGQLYLTGLAAAYAEAGRERDARDILEKLRVMSETRYVSPYLLALVHVFLGEHDRALALLEEAVRIRDAWVMWLVVEPQLDALRSDSKFRELVLRTNNPAATRQPDSMSAGFAAAEEEKSIAVLPLKILGGRGAGGDEYLSIGLADALITRLSNVRRFVMRPTSSVLRYRGEAGADPVAAGRELNVDYVLDGNIRHAGDSIRVTAQLLSVAEGATRWAGHFDEKVTDVLALEDSLSAQVADALVPHLTNEEREKLQKRGTDNPEAFEAYMRGRHHWNTFSEEGFAKALVCYNQAVALAPDYALAYAGIADYYNWLGVYAVLPFAETSAAAKEAALKAVSLDPELAEAYSALGFATVMHDFDWESCERQLRRAIELNPNYGTGRLWYCYFLGMSGRFDEAHAQARRAMELDPLSAIVQQTLSWIQYYARRYEDSVASARALAEREPRYGLTQVFLSMILAHTGRYDESIEAAKNGMRLLGRSPYTLGWMASAEAAAGHRDEALKLIDELKEMSATRYVSPYMLAMAYRNLGDQENTLTELERALAIRDARLMWLGVDPLFDSLRDEPRFDEILRQTNNPVRARRTSRARAESRSRPVTGGTPTPPPAETQARVSTPPSAALVPPPPAAPARPTENEEAHQLYVAGRYYATRRTAEGLRQAIERFERAVERDPKFALAYAELADCYALLNWYVEPSPADAWPKAREAAERAVAADDTLAEAHASLGFVISHYDRDLAGAERELRRAVELKPDNPVARRWHAFNLSAMGRHDEAVAEMMRARDLNPRSPVMANAVANVLFHARRFDEAIEQCRRALELDPGSVAAHVVLRWAYEMKGMRDEAMLVFEQERVFAGDTPTTRAKRAHVLAAVGRRDEARQILEELLAKHEERGVTAYEIAVICSLLGDTDEALRWLEQAEREHAVGLTFVRVDPHLDSLRSDPRFDELLRRLSTPRSRGGRAAADASTAAERTLAVLPFKVVNPGEDGDTGDAYLGVGLADALITRLSNIRSLAVRPTSAVARFDNDSQDPVETGRTLGVAFVLDGRVLLAGARLRVTVQLIRVSDRTPIWAEKFDADHTDILSVHDTVSEQVAVALVPQLSGDERARVSSHGTEDAKAYEAYLRGRYHWNRISEDGFARSIESYREAICLDPSFALAHAGVADYYNWLGVYGVRPSAECSAEARREAGRAVELDPRLAEGHAALNFAAVSLWDWEAAERHIKKAIELNPNYATAYNFYCLQLAAQGRWEEFETVGRRAMELDPSSPHLGETLGWGYYHSRRFDESLNQLRRSLELEPNFVISRWALGWTLAQAGRFEEAVSEVERAALLTDRGSLPVLAALAGVHALAGDEGSARKVLSEVTEKARGRYVSPYHLALVHANLGEDERALALLEAAADAREGWLIWVKGEPQLDRLRHHARFAAVVGRVHPSAS